MTSSVVNFSGTSLVRCSYPRTQKLGIKTGKKTDALYRAIVESGFKNAADVPGGANDDLSQLDTVSEAESEDARNGTQTEHNGATTVMGVVGWPGRAITTICMDLEK